MLKKGEAFLPVIQDVIVTRGHSPALNYPQSNLATHLSLNSLARLEWSKLIPNKDLSSLQSIARVLWSLKRTEAQVLLAEHPPVIVHHTLTQLNVMNFTQCYMTKYLPLLNKSKWEKKRFIRWSSWSRRESPRLKIVRMLWQTKMNSNVKLSNPSSNLAEI